MDSGISRIEPGLFSGLLHFGPAVNSRIVQSEVEGGVRLEDLPTGAKLEIRTRNSCYTLVNQGAGRALLSGHPEFCPQPTEVSIHGSTWGGTMMRSRFVGRGMFLEFSHPQVEGRIVTSQIVGVREIQ